MGRSSTRTTTTRSRGTGRSCRAAKPLTKDWTDSGDVERTVEKPGGGPAVMVGDSTWDCGATCVFASLSELREQSADTPLS